MEEIYASFIESVDRSVSSKSFRFEKPDGFSFLPGQFLQVIFDEEDRKNKDLNKYLSFSNAPHENYLEVTKRISDSDFSSRLCFLKKGDKVLLKAPMGNCVYNSEMTRIAFLIGGIGITPVVSIIDHIVHNQINTDIVLIYSNRTEDDVPFKEKFDKYSVGHNNFKVLYTVTSCQPQDEKCFSGFITKELLDHHITDFNERIIFIFGVPSMVASMREICGGCSCSKDKIKFENFMGY